MNGLFVTVTTLGGPVGMGAIVASVLAVLVARRRFRWAAYLAITSAGGTLLNQLLKFHYARQRPDLKAADVLLRVIFRGGAGFGRGRLVEMMANGAVLVRAQCTA